MAAARRFSPFSLLALASAAAAATCVGRDGAPVAWWFALTPPRGRGAPAFADATDPTPRELAAFASVASNSSSGDPLAATLASLFGARATAAAAVWNDAPPDGAPFFTGAHSKGLLAFDGASGLWLTHSAPRWPPPLCGEYGPPRAPQRLFAQSFLCLTLDGDASFASASTHVASAVAPHVFSARVRPAAAARFPGLAALAGLAPRPPPPFNGSACLALSGVLACAGTGAPPRDLWSSVLAPALAAPLAVATWNHEGRLLGPVCETGRWAVLNVAASEWGSALVPAGESHAKWGVALAPAAPTLCVGDTNRADAQRARAGGAVCLVGARAVGVAARAAVRATDPCPMLREAAVAAL